ncbi:MAG: CNNM domain-containing protein, partial [Verrucomicrobiia bacterium]
EGVPHAAETLEVIEEPGKVLTAIRFGVIFAIVLAGARVGGAVTERIQSMITETTWLQPVARPLSLGLAALALTMAVVFIVELLPRRLA